MISHVHVGVGDFERALDFYNAVLGELGLSLKFVDPERQWAGWIEGEAARPIFIVGRPYDGQVAQAGNGQMVALLAKSRDVVDRVHSMALSKGATNEGNAGLRPEYHANFYGAYFRDLEGNKLCVCCHSSFEDRRGDRGAT